MVEQRTFNSEVLGSNPNTPRGAQTHVPVRALQNNIRSIVLLKILHSKIAA